MHPYNIRARFRGSVLGDADMRTRSSITFSHRRSQRLSRTTDRVRTAGASLPWRSCRQDGPPGWRAAVSAGTRWSCARVCASARCALASRGISPSNGTAANRWGPRRKDLGPRTPSYQSRISVLFERRGPSAFSVTLQLHRVGTKALLGLFADEHNPDPGHWEKTRSTQPPAVLEP